METTINTNGYTSTPQNELDNDSDHNDSLDEGTDKINELQNTSEESIKTVFQNSTHYYMIHVSDENNERSINLFILGFGVVLLQFILYFCIIASGISILTVTELPVTISSFYCSSIEYWEKLGIEYSVGDSAECATTTSASSLYLILAMIMVSTFLQYDYFASIKILLVLKKKWSKIAASLILTEAILATLCCSLFASRNI